MPALTARTDTIDDKRFYLELGVVGIIAGIVFAIIAFMALDLHLRPLLLIGIGSFMFGSCHVGAAFDPTDKTRLPRFGATALLVLCIVTTIYMMSTPIH